MDRGRWAIALVVDNLALVEVTEVRLSGDDGGHGRDIESYKTNVLAFWIQSIEELYSPNNAPPTTATAAITYTFPTM